jgi:hypothetical protein
LKALVVLAAIASCPSLAAGQPAIAGSVKNAAGEFLAGVSVVASSPALIEHTRTAVTDNAGRYRIE